MSNNNFFKRFISMLLAFTLILGIIPSSVYAGNDEKLILKYDENLIKKIEIGGKEFKNNAELKLYKGEKDPKVSITFEDGIYINKTIFENTDKIVFNEKYPSKSDKENEGSSNVIGYYRDGELLRFTHGDFEILKKPGTNIDYFEATLADLIYSKFDDEDIDINEENPENPLYTPNLDTKDYVGNSFKNITFDLSNFRDIRNSITENGLDIYLTTVSPGSTLFSIESDLEKIISINEGEKDKLDEEEDIEIPEDSEKTEKEKEKEKELEKTNGDFTIENTVSLSKDNGYVKNLSVSEDKLDNTLYWKVSIEVPAGSKIDGIELYDDIYDVATTNRPEQVTIDEIYDNKTSAKEFSLISKVDNSQKDFNNIKDLIDEINRNGNNSYNIEYKIESAGLGKDDSELEGRGLVQIVAAKITTKDKGIIKISPAKYRYARAYNEEKAITDIYITKMYMDNKTYEDFNLELNIKPGGEVDAGFEEVYPITIGSALDDMEVKDIYYIGDQPNTKFYQFGFEELEYEARNKKIEEFYKKIGLLADDEIYNAAEFSSNKEQQEKLKEILFNMAEKNLSEYIKEGYLRECRERDIEYLEKNIEIKNGDPHRKRRPVEGYIGLDGDTGYGHLDHTGVLTDKESLVVDIEYNGEDKGVPSINKYFDNAPKLKNAKFIVYDAEGNKFKEGYTDRYGLIKFTLPDGYYEIVEVQSDRTYEIYESVEIKPAEIENLEKGGIDENDDTAYIYINNKQPLPTPDFKGELSGPMKFKAVPIILDLPISNGARGWVKELTLYPKNTENKPTIEKNLLDKDVNDKLINLGDGIYQKTEENSFDIGEDVYWEVKTSLPKQLVLDKLSIYDLPSTAIDIDEIYEVYVDGKKITEYEEITELSTKENSVKYEEVMDYINKREDGREHYGKVPTHYVDRIGLKVNTLGVKFEGDNLKAINKIIASTTKESVDVLIIVKGRINGRDLEVLDPNEDGDFRQPNMGVVEYTIDGHPKIDVDENIIRTGGRRFIKINIGKDPLKGAEFIVKKMNHDGSYSYLRVYDSDKLSFEWIDSANLATKLISGEDGVLFFEESDYNYTEGEEGADVSVVRDLKGLKDGAYFLEEIKAPEGYAKLTNLKEFEINKTSYNGLDPMEIINTKLTIPETGGIGSLIFIAVGIIVVGTGIYAKKRRGNLA